MRLLATTRCTDVFGLLPLNARHYKAYGKVLYDENHYRESLAFFRKLKKTATDRIEENAIEEYTGMNYLRLGRFKQARALFSKLAKSDRPDERRRHDRRRHF